MWLTGEGRDPRFTWELVGTDPLVLADVVEYRTPDGAEKRIEGTDTWKRDGFVRRGKSVRKLFASRWQVAGASDDGSVLVLRFEESRATPAGLDVLVREGSSHPELRSTVAADVETFGLSPEEFASLTWLLRP